MSQEDQSAVGDQRAVLAKLPMGCVVSVTGVDAVKIINNLTTNDVRKLPIDGVCESLVTDVRGWVVAHGMVVRLAGEYQLVGQFPQPDAIVNHIDRYIVREDAIAVNRAADLTVFLVHGADSHLALAQVFGCEPSFPNRQSAATVQLSGVEVLLIATQAYGSDSRFAVVPSNFAGDFRQKLLSNGFEWCEQPDELESRRIASFWPLAGREIVEKTLPQELDRDSIAISFTKGCYLGQETVARLDARGQLQKKLCLLRVTGTPGNIRELSRDGKPAGQITSLGAVRRNGSTLALAYLKRGNFDSGTRLHCEEFIAEVLEQPEL